MKTEPLKILSPLHKAYRQIDLYLEREVRNLEVSNTEGHLLTYLAQYGPCPVSELFRVFGFKRSTLTSVLDRLEARGLVDRKIDPKDRRSWKVSIRPDGRKLANKIRKRLEALEARITAKVTKGDLARFRKVLNTVEEVTRVSSSAG